MESIEPKKRRPLRALMLVVAVAGGAVFGLYKGRVEIPSLHTSRLYAYLDTMVARAHQTRDRLVGSGEAESHHEGGEGEHESQAIVVTNPQKKDVVLTQQYVCQIHSQNHIKIRALESGYLKQILVKEGQAVKKGDLMFKIVPTLYQARLDAENAEARLAALELKNTKRLFDTKVVSQNEVFLLEAKLAKAQAKAELAGAELEFTNVRAPFDGIVDRLLEQVGSLISEGDELTTLSDNSLMWVYFNVPERDYLDYMDGPHQGKDDRMVELELANLQKFPQPGKIATIEAKFNNVTGNIPFRADFPNPKGLLRHGQTGNVYLRRVAPDAIVIPQRATFEILDRRYVYVVDKDSVVHQREIQVDRELDDVYVLRKGVGVDEKIVLEGMRDLRDGDKVTYEFRHPEVVVAQLKNRAE